MKKGREDEVMKTIRRTLLYVNRQKKTDRTLLSLTAFGPLSPLFSHEGKRGVNTLWNYRYHLTRNTNHTTNALATFCTRRKVMLSYSFLNLFHLRSHFKSSQLNICLLHASQICIIILYLIRFIIIIIIIMTGK